MFDAVDPEPRRKLVAFWTDKTLAIESNNPTLTALNLDDEDIKDKGMAVLVESLKKNRTIRSLSLAHTGLGAPSGPVLEDLLRHNSALTELDVSDNVLGEAGVVALANSLRTSHALAPNRTLLRLRLKNCHGGPDGARALAQALAFNDNLRVGAKLMLLDLSGCQVLDPGIQALSACLQFNSSLVSLGLSYSGLRAPGVCALCKGVAANGTLTALDLNNAWGAKDAMECFAEVGELLREARGASRLQHLSVGGNYGGDEGMALLLHARR